MSRKILPAKFIIRFFRWFCRPDYVEDIEGDLLERFAADLQGQTRLSTNLRFAWEVLKLLRPGIIKPLFKRHTNHSIGMFRNYLKTTIRSARKEKAFTLLNVSCLTIGLCACFYIAVYTLQELSFDKFHEKADRIYRINMTFIWGDVDQLFGSTGPAVMNAIQNEIPDFEQMTRVLTFENALVSVASTGGSKVFEEPKLRAVDATFFDVFTFPLIAGNPREALVDPQSVVLTESTALKYFGTTDILGKEIRVQDEDSNKLYQVTGVAEDVPDNSHVTFDLLLSMSSIDRLKRNGDTWWWTTFVTFGLLREDANPEWVSQKLAQVPGKYLEPFLLKYRDMTYEEFVASGETWDLFMQPLLDIHLYSTHVFSRLNEIGDIETIYILNIIALLILALSITNFVNLTTARASRRMKEVGVRKALGTDRSGLVFQFLLESTLLCLISLLMSGLLLYFLLPLLNDVAGKQLSFRDFMEPGMQMLLLGISIFIGLIAGIYPAFSMSAVKPVRAFKPDQSKDGGTSRLRNVLITFQFTASIGLIACGLIIHDQVQHWLNKELGFEKDNVLVVRRADRLEASKDAFLGAVQGLPGVEHASMSNDTPPYVMGSHRDFYLQGQEQLKKEISYWTADEHFMDVYGLQLLAGENFRPGFNNKGQVLVSRSTMETFGIQNPLDILGKRLRRQDDNQTIIGVFEDINTEIRWKQLPLVIYYNDAVFTPVGPGKEVSVRFAENLSGTQIASLLAAIDEQWSGFSSGIPMQSYFLDQRFRSIFEVSIRFGKLMSFFAVLSCLIAGLGLVGLVAYVIERRNKEIGIRKVLGASVTSVMVLLTSDFGRLLVLGFFIASGLSWYFMDQWIQGFEDQITLGPGIFILAGGLMLMIMIATLSIQVVRAAFSNPVKYLRDE